MHRAAAKYGFNIFLSGQLGSTRRLGRFLDGVKAVFREEGADPDTMNVALLRFGYVTDNKRDADQYVDGARYQQRLAVALKRRQEMVEDDYWVREVPYDDELPFAKMTDNIPVGSVEKCAELVANEIRTLGITHYVIQPQIGDVENAKSLRSMERWMTEVVPMVEKELGQPLATVNPQNDPSAIVP
jgi:alkanesulfonate monooxygenase SsuD/methylene tetrahydromethanopterin reductase-like flavin-dependent oxidoreductase (luciferase family)